MTHTGFHAFKGVSTNNQIGKAAIAPVIQTSISADNP